jgi:LPPG:FO 2-phospho-L-lactate transferase
VVVVLAGGTGGAKLARGMLDVVGGHEVCVVANTGDDVEVYGVHVSPDPDLVALWLADVIDARGFGLRGDTWEVMEALERAGRETWFQLGDRDLALCLVRTELLRSGRRLTEAHAEVVHALGLGARVLPMCDEPVRTHVRASGHVRPFQEFMIVDRAEPDIEGVELRGIEAARPTPEVLAAIEGAGAIVIGPSNPVISIGPILAVPGMGEAITRAPAPVVAVSPFVGGRAVKGPTEAFCAHAGIEASARGIADAYAGIIDGVVADELVEGVPAVEIDTLMDTPADRARMARATLDLARAIGDR